MGFLKNIFSGRQDNEQDRVGREEAPVPLEDLIDVRFNESDRTEGELQELWNSYERALNVDKQIAEEILLNFFERFGRAFEGWEPDELNSTLADAYTTLEASRAFPHPLPPSSGSRGMPKHRISVQSVKGCAGGHPRPVLHGLVGGLERAPEQLSARLLREAASAKELLSVGGAPYLRALSMLLRSRHNRAVLSSMGALCVLADVLGTLSQKLSTAVGVVAVQHAQRAWRGKGGGRAGVAGAGVTPAAAVHLEVLQTLLLYCLQAVHTFVERERQCRERLHQGRGEGEGLGAAMEAAAAVQSEGQLSPSHAVRYAQQEAAELTMQAACAEEVEYAVHALVERCVVLRCLDVCESLLRLRQHGGELMSQRESSPPSMTHYTPHANLASDLEQLCLRCAAELLCCSSEAVKQLSSPSHDHQFEFLGHMLGWPLPPGRPPPTAPSRHSSLPSPGSSPQQQPSPDHRVPDLPAMAQHAQHGALLRSPRAELALQLLALKAWGPLLRSPPPSTLQRFKALGGCARLTHLLHWVVLCFADGTHARPAGELDQESPRSTDSSRAADAGGLTGGRLGSGAEHAVGVAMTGSTARPAGEGGTPPGCAPAGADVGAGGECAGDAEAAAWGPRAELALQHASWCCCQLDQVFEVLWEWVVRSPAPLGRPCPGGGAGLGAAQPSRVLPLVVAALLDAFRPAVATLAAQQAQHAKLRTPPGHGGRREGGPLLHAGQGHASSPSPSPSPSLPPHPHHDTVVSLLSFSSTALQHCVLRFCGALLTSSVQPSRHSSSAAAAQLAVAHLEALRRGGLWRVVLGPAFLLWGGGYAQQGKHGQSAAQRDNLKSHALALLQQAATVPAAPDNEAEVEAMVTALESDSPAWRDSEDTGYRIPCAPLPDLCATLCRVLEQAPSTTLRAMDAVGMLSVLARTLTIVQRQLAGMGSSGECADEPSGHSRPVEASAPELSEGGASGVVDLMEGQFPAPSLLRSARFALLNLLQQHLSMDSTAQRRAVQAWDPVTALFVAAWEGDEATRKLALQTVVLLMCTAPEAEDDRLAKAALFTKYTETLPRAVHSWRQQGVGLISDLLHGMRSVVAADPHTHQQLFSQAQAIVHVLNVLNEEYPHEEGVALGTCVLDTLGALVAGNEALRLQISEVVGYEVLLDALSTRCAPAPPPQPLLLSVLGLILEEPPHAGERFRSTIIANSAAIPLFFQLLRRGAAPVQLWGLAAWRELLLQGTENLIACNQAGLNSLLIAWTAAELVPAGASGRHGTAEQFRSCGAADGAEGDDRGGGEELEGGCVGTVGGGGREAPLSDVCHQLLGLLRLTGSYSITGAELQSLLALLMPLPGNKPILPRYALPLLHALSEMAAHHGPPNFFNFGTGPGGLPAGISCQATLRHPPRGYTLALWLRAEVPHSRDAASSAPSRGATSAPPPSRRGSSSEGGAAGGAQSQRTQHAVAALLSKAGEAIRGVVVALEGQQLMAHTWAPKHAEVALGCQLAPRRWCHLAICHSAGGTLSQPSMRVFLDGQLQATHHKVRYPGSSSKEPLNAACFGAAAAPAMPDLAMLPFQGQMGAIMLFDDVLLPAQLQALAHLGPAYQSTLSPSESSALLDQSPEAAALLTAPRDAPLPRLQLCYAPQAVQGGRVLQDLAGGSPATLLPGTNPCCTRQPQDMLHCLGGMAILLPLLDLLDPHPPCGQSPSRQALRLEVAGRWEIAEGEREEEAAAAVVRLVTAMVEGSPANMQALKQINGVPILGHLLGHAHPAHLSHGLVVAVEGLLMAVAPSEELHHDVLRHLLLNLRMWRAVRAEVQDQLITVLLHLAETLHGTFRKLLPVPALLDHIRTHLGARQPGTRLPLAATLAPAGDSGVDIPPPPTDTSAQVSMDQGAGDRGGGGGPPPMYADSAHAPHSVHDTKAHTRQDGPGVEEVAGLRKGYLGVVKAVLSAAAAEGSGRGGAPGQAPLKFLADTRALVSFVGDCCDAVLLEDVLCMLCALLRRDSLARMPLLVCIMELGGASLFLSLTSREQPTLRVLGLKLVTACLDGTRSIPSTGHVARGSAQGAAAGVVQGVGEGLLAFPLTPVVRIALLQMACGGVPWVEIDNSNATSPPPRVVFPQAVSLLLRLVAASDNEAERCAALSVLCKLVESRDPQLPPQPGQQAQHANLAMLASLAGWEQLLLDVLCVPPSTPSATHGGGWSAPAYYLLLRLLCHGVKSVTDGASHLTTLVAVVRSQPAATYQIPAATPAEQGPGCPMSAAHPPFPPSSTPPSARDVGAGRALGEEGDDPGGEDDDEAGVAGAGAGAIIHVSASQLLHTVIADVMTWLAKAQAAEDALHLTPSSPTLPMPRRLSLTRSRTHSDPEPWTVVSPWATEPYLSNAAAVISIAADLWSGALPLGAGAPPTPSPGAQAWAAAASSPSPPTSIPPEVWSTLGAATSSSTLPAQHPPLLSWQLEATWRFAGGMVGMAGGELQQPASATSTGSTLSPGGGGRGGLRVSPAGSASSMEDAEVPQLPRALLRLLSRTMLCVLRHGTAQQMQGAVARIPALLGQLVLPTPAAFSHHPPVAPSLHPPASAAAPPPLAHELQLLLAALLQTHKAVTAATTVHPQDQGQLARHQHTTTAGEAAQQVQHGLQLGIQHGDVAGAGAALQLPSSSNTGVVLEEGGVPLLQRGGWILQSMNALVTEAPAAFPPPRAGVSVQGNGGKSGTGGGSSSTQQAAQAAAVARSRYTSLRSELLGGGAGAAAATSAAAPAAAGLGLPELLCMLRSPDVVAAAVREVKALAAAGTAQEVACQDAQLHLGAVHLQEQQAVQAVLQEAREVLGLAVGADRLRRGAGRRAAEEDCAAVQHQWRDLYRSLVSERGLWAVEEAEEAIHWKLDPAEDPSRRRLRLKRKYNFVLYNDAPRPALPSTATGGGGAPQQEGGAGGQLVAAEGGAGGLEREESVMRLRKLVPGANPQALLMEEDEEDQEEDAGAGPGALRLGTSQGHSGELQGGGREALGPEGAGTGGGGDEDVGTPECGGPAGQQSPSSARKSRSPSSASESPLAGSQPRSAASSAPPSPKAGAPVGAPSLPRLALGRRSAGVPMSLSPLSHEAREAAAQQAMHDPAMHAYAIPRVEGEQELAVTSPSLQTMAAAGAAADVLPSAVISPRIGNAATPRRGSERETGAARVSTLGSVTALPAVGVAAAEEQAAAAADFSDEQVVLSVTSQWVRPKHVVSGQLDITSSHVHFSGMIEDEEGAATEVRSPSRASGEELGGDSAGQHMGRPSRRRTRRWALSTLMEAHHSRYLLQPTALELFASDRTSHALFNFESNQVMRDVAAALHKAHPALLVYDRKKKMEWAQRLQARWVRWELSNFDYIMALNTLAGRSFQDLNQYPVFPWVLSDYTSPTLDLNDPAAFRDLSKPIGALNDKRLAFFLERYDSLRQDPEIPPFHYGSHYSSAGTVLFYLLRLEPFTCMCRDLQGGRFDHADRLFHSIAATWQNCLDSSSDVKELTPEFYSQPEFLRNSNDFYLGTRQDGIQLGDAELPPWANGSPEEFVRVMREALESDVVSQSLHGWIDLVFGQKQRGKGAEEAVNTFYYLTYEGTVDLESIRDPMQRRSVEEQIRHFGQTPMQLFRRRHPPRGSPPSPSLRPLLNGPDVMRRSALGLPMQSRAGIPIVLARVLEGRVVVAHCDRCVSSHRWFPSKADAGAFTFSTGAMDAGTASIELEGGRPRSLAGALPTAPNSGGGAGGSVAPALAAVQQYAVLHGDRVLLSCGYLDGSIHCNAVDDGALLQCVCYHRDIVTCMAVSSDGGTLASGSRDTTLMVWEANAAYGGKESRRARGMLPLVPRPRHVLYGHQDEVTCLAISHELDVVVSGAADGTVLVHSLMTGRYIRTLQLPASVPPTLLRVAPYLGLILAHSHSDLQLHVLTINGRHLVSADTHERLSAAELSPDGRLLLTAGNQGTVTLRWLHSLQVVLRYDAGRGPLTALAITPEDCFLAGSAEGSLVLFAPDPRRCITTRFNLADVRPAASKEKRTVAGQQQCSGL